MKIIRGIGKAIKPFVNFPRWIGLKQLYSTGKTLAGDVKVLYTPKKATRHESFEEAMIRLNLSEQDLQQRAHQCRRMVMLYGFIALALFSYAVFLFFHVHIAAGFLSLVLMGLALSLTFREHFFYFQIKKRKLGCTPKEWFLGTFGGSKK